MRLAAGESIIAIFDEKLYFVGLRTVVGQGSQPSLVL